MIFGGDVDAIDQAQHESGWCGCAICLVRAEGTGHDKQSRAGVPETGEAGA